MNTVHLLTLLAVPKIGKTTVKRILDAIPTSPENGEALAQALQAKWSTIRNDPRMRETAPTYPELKTAYTKAQQILSEAKAAGVTIIGFSDPAFPAQLKTLPQSIVVLYAKGNVEILARPSVTIIGKAEPSAYGKACAKRFGEIFAHKKIVVVTCLDAGCDAIGNEGAVKSGGRSILIMANGLDDQSVDKAIIKETLDRGGVLLSESLHNAGNNPALNTPPNLLRGGLSRAVVIVEADDSTMSTAKFCTEQKRKIACLRHSGKYESALPESNKKLIASGAKPLADSADLETFLESVFSASGVQPATPPQQAPVKNVVQTPPMQPIAKPQPTPQQPPAPPPAPVQPLMPPKMPQKSQNPLAPYLESLFERFGTIRLIDPPDAQVKVLDVYMSPEVEINVAPQVVITGEPGTGKSTLLHGAALRMAQELLNGNPNLPIPILIELHTLFGASPDEVITVTKLLRFVQTEQLEPNMAQFADLQQYLDAGKITWFFDGLDEVPRIDEPARRGQIEALMVALHEKFPTCRLLITSRPYAYSDWALNGFQTVSLIPFSAANARTLAGRVIKALNGSQDAGTSFAKTAAVAAPDLIGNPLFCTSIASMWLNAGQPALTKAGIYKWCVDTLTVHWVRKREEITPASAGLGDEQWWALLETIAFDVHHIEGEKIFGVDVIVRAASYYKLKALQQNLLIALLSRRAGLLEEVGGKFKFVYPAFEEHLAACYLARPKIYPQEMVNAIRKQPDLWQNVFDLLPDEARRWGHELAKLLDALLPEKGYKGKAAAWSCIPYASRLLFNAHEDTDLETIYRPRLIAAGAALLSIGALSVMDRVEVGRWLAELGDPRPGVGLTENGLPDIVWCKVASGKFIYGNESENNGPIEATLPAFSIAKYPVTVAQYEAYLKATSSGSRRDEIPANHPQQNVSGHDAVAFCGWLSEQLGYEVRLPTEQEWEKAARGKDGRDYPYGAEFDSDLNNTVETGLGQTSPVGLFPDGAAPCGALDMSGNVLEWTSTRYSDGDTLILRGGSWCSEAAAARTTSREHLSPDARQPFAGFRLVRGV